MTMQVVARTVALAIAVAAVIDPAVDVTRSERLRVGVVIADSATLDLPGSLSSAGTRRDEAIRLRDRLAAALAPADVDSRPAQGQHALVVIGDALPLGLRVPSGAALATIDVGGPLGPNVVVESIRVPARVPVGGRVAVAVALRGTGLDDQASTVTLTAGALTLASQTHTWQAGTSRADVVFDVIPWTAGPLTFRATVSHSASEATTADNRADSVALAEEHRVRVLILDAHPSWTTRFVALALEHVPEVALTSRTGLGRGVSVRTTTSADDVALTAASLDDYDLAIVSSLDAETVATSDWLDAFMDTRGGTVLVLADDLPGVLAARRWLPLALGDRITDAPTPISVAGRPDVGWRATAFALPRAVPSDARVIASTAETPPRPVIVAKAIGAGRLVVNVAFDTWRFRGDDRVSFAHSWRDVVVGLGRTVARPLDLDVTKVVSPGATIRIGARRRTTTKGPLPMLPVATVTTPALARDVVLWPTAAEGAFAAELDAGPDAGLAVVSVLDAGSTAGAAVTVDGSARAENREGLPLDWLASAHGGLATRAASYDSTLPQLRRHLDAARRNETVIVYPLRSAWWLLPFVLALGLEWALRRRAGLR